MNFSFPFFEVLCFEFKNFSRDLDHIITFSKKKLRLGFEWNAEDLHQGMSAIAEAIVSEGFPGFVSQKVKLCCNLKWTRIRRTPWSLSSELFMQYGVQPILLRICKCGFHESRMNDHHLPFKTSPQQMWNRLARLSAARFYPWILLVKFHRDNTVLGFSHDTICCLIDKFGKVHCGASTHVIYAYFPSGNTRAAYAPHHAIPIPRSQLFRSQPSRAASGLRIAWSYRFCNPPILSVVSNERFTRRWKSSIFSFWPPKQSWRLTPIFCSVPIVPVHPGGQYSASDEILLPTMSRYYFKRGGKLLQERRYLFLELVYLYCKDNIQGYLQIYTWVTTLGGLSKL